MKYLAIDCETGGFEPETTSLLEVSLIAATKLENNKFRIDGKFTYKAIPNDFRLIVEPQALRVNNFDLKNWDKEAKSYSLLGEWIKQFLRIHRGRTNDKFIPVGHNLRMDLKYIQYHLVNKYTWNNLVSYRAIDTAILTRFLRDCGKLPETMMYTSKGSSLSHIASFFGIDVSDAHSAEGDAILSLRVYEKLIQCVKS